MDFEGDAFDPEETLALTRTLTLTLTLTLTPTLTRRERDGLALQLRAAKEQAKETEASLLQRLDRVEAPWLGLGSGL